MDPIDSKTYFIFAILLAAWCVLHSAMISTSITDYLSKYLGNRFRFYRLFFNIVSVSTLVPIVLFAHSIQTQVIFRWEGYWQISQFFLLGMAVLFFFLGTRHYDASQFFGIKQINSKNSTNALSSTGKLNTSGILGVTRHPWYFATILLIWARSMDISAVILNVIFTCYLIIGTYLEEKKLIREFGETYLSYRREVSMLFPYKWLRARIIKPQ